MNESQQELFEKQLLSIAQDLDYPRTPDVAGSVMRRLRGYPSPSGTIAPEAQRSRGGARGEGRPRFPARRLAWSLTLLLVLCSSLMLIPSARAAIIEFIQVGVVRIFRAEPTPLTPPNQQAPSMMVPVTATPGPTSQPLIPVLENLAGEMTLAEAQQAVDYPILLPSYPPGLGQPDYNFVQDADGAMTILVWLDPQQPDEVLMSLHFIPEGSWAIEKVNPIDVQETTVKGQRAIWAIGPYPLRFSNGDLDFVRLIDGHVLIWAEGEVTYRLETDLSLEEAIKVAESLEPIR
ncbi:MAG: hypothetical protein EHM33_13395 [Chloroflexi bacterium]|nr:MAG: hypothetical protein EHM33_13395 [Chloroflexota bacterium]